MIKISKVLQLSSQPSYAILGALFFYGLQRPLSNYVYLIFFAMAAYYLSVQLSNKLHSADDNPWSLTPFIIAGNIILNMEAYSFSTYCYAVIFAVLSRALLRTKDGHIFNPGYFGIFCMTMLFPKLSYPSLGLWQSNNYFVLLIFLMGNFVVYQAKRLYLIYSYIFSFVLFSVLFGILCKLSGINFNGNIDVSILFWPATLTTTTSLVFIYHVISDPKTSPSSPMEQILFGLMIGTIDFFLRMNLILPAEMIAYISTQLIFSLYRSFMTPALVPEKVIQN